MKRDEVLPTRCLFFLLFSFIPILVVAELQTSGSERTIATGLISLNKLNSLQRRLEIQSSALLNTPYHSGALGEGEAGEYDKNPLYRFDCFDCETYVDTVMALALAKNFSDFKNKINRIRYKRANVNFMQRNHFPSADWIPNNIKNGYIQELTPIIAGKKTKISKAFINRCRWYQHLTMDRIQIPTLSDQEKALRLIQLKQEGKWLQTEVVSIAYIPVLELLHNSPLTQRIPSGSLIFFVGHDPSLASRIGTAMNVLHMGLSIWHDNQLYCRMASSRAGKVIDARLQDYLKTYLPLGILAGVSVWSIRDQA